MYYILVSLTSLASPRVELVALSTAGEMAETHMEQCDYTHACIHMYIHVYMYMCTCSTPFMCIHVHVHVQGPVQGPVHCICTFLSLNAYTKYTS